MAVPSHAHTDTPPHTDTPHMDTGHIDTPPHTDTPHQDVHSDFPHGDAHADRVHIDLSHFDLAHNDSHHLDWDHLDSHHDQVHGDLGKVDPADPFGRFTRQLGTLIEGVELRAAQRHEHQLRGLSGALGEILHQVGELRERVAALETRATAEGASPPTGRGRK